MGGCLLFSGAEERVHIFAMALFSVFEIFQSTSSDFLNMIEGGKIEYQEAKASLNQCGKRDS